MDSHSRIMPQPDSPAAIRPSRKVSKSSRKQAHPNSRSNPNPKTALNPKSETKIPQGNITADTSLPSKANDSNWKTIKESLKPIEKNASLRKKKSSKQERLRKKKKLAPMNSNQSPSQQPATSTPKDFEGNVDFIKFDMSDHEQDLDDLKLSEGNRPANPTGNQSQGTKRKYAAGPGVSEAEANELRKKKGMTITPWFDTLQWKNRNVQQMLTAEIGSFVAYIKPTQEEDELRLMVIEMIRRVVQDRWHDADVVPFGSFGTKLYLPGGDIDLVILSPKMMNEPKSKVLYRLAPLIRENNIGQDVVVIAKAKVPIVKFKTIFGNFNVDISINQSNGLVAMKSVNKLLDDVKYLSIDLQSGARAHQMSQSKTRKGKRRDQQEAETDLEEEAVNKVVESLGAAKCMILVIKSLLKQRGMNEVYSGGLGSYSIICLVISFLQLHPKVQRGDIDPNKNLGVLLLEFLELYGKHYNFDETGISVNNGGSYFSKSKRGWQRERQPYLLSIEDPADETNDISGGSHNITGVRAVFSGAFDLLCATLYHRHSLRMSRADEISSRRLQTSRPLLAVPKPNQANDDPEDVLQDPMEQSLLGEIMGVTKELVENRKKNLKFYYSGTIQRVLNMSPPPTPPQDAQKLCQSSSKSAEQTADQNRESKPKKKKKKGKEMAADYARSENRAGAEVMDRVEPLPRRSVDPVPPSTSQSARSAVHLQPQDYIALEDTDNERDDGNIKRDKGMNGSTRSVIRVEDRQRDTSDSSVGLVARLPRGATKLRNERRVGSANAELLVRMNKSVDLDLPNSLVINLAMAKNEKNGREAQDADDDSRYNIFQAKKAKRAKHHSERLSHEDQYQAADFTASQSSPSSSSSHSPNCPKGQRSLHDTNGPSYDADENSDVEVVASDKLEGQLQDFDPSSAVFSCDQLYSESKKTLAVSGGGTPPGEPYSDVPLTFTTMVSTSPGTPCGSPPPLSSIKRAAVTATPDDTPRATVTLDLDFSPGTPVGTPPPSTTRISHEEKQQMWLSKGGLLSDAALD